MIKSPTLADETETVKRKTLQRKVVKLKRWLILAEAKFLEAISMNYVTSGCIFSLMAPKEWLDVGEEPELPKSLIFRGFNGFSGCSDVPLVPLVEV